MYLGELEERGWLCFDDFKSMAARHSRQFRDSPRFRTLLACLSDGARCAVTDIDFCRTESRAEATDVLRAEVPDVEIRWVYFSHNVEDCAGNIRRRARRSVQQDLEQLSRYSAFYQIPEGAKERPCHRCPEGLIAQTGRGTGIVLPRSGAPGRTCS